MVTSHAYTSTGSLPPYISEVRSGSKRHVMERLSLVFTSHAIS